MITRDEQCQINHGPLGSSLDAVALDCLFDYAACMRCDGAYAKSPVTEWQYGTPRDTARANALISAWKRPFAYGCRSLAALRRAMPIREMNRSKDRRGVEALDTSFETSKVYEVVTGPQRLELALRDLPVPIVKRYPIADAFAPWCSWDTAWVAEEAGTIVGFAAVEYEAWHARLVLWHVYVTRSHRRTGVGRALLAQVEVHGRERGAQRVWLETTNVNVPGIAAYARLGYTLCGLDVTEYDTLPYADETAVYLAKGLR